MSNRNDDLAAIRARHTTGYELTTDRADIGLVVYTKPAPKPNHILAKCFIGRAGNPSWFYMFGTAHELENYVNQQIGARNRSLAEKAKRKAEQSAPAEVSVGDVFESHWGYDQTNIDYYQVTRVVSPKTIIVRKIAAVSWDTHYMQGRCVPSTDNFIGQPMTKRVKPYGDNGASITINSFANAYKMKPVIDGTPLYGSSAWTAYA